MYKTKGFHIMQEAMKNPPCGGIGERLTLGPDFNLFRSISGAARSVLRTAEVTRLYDTAHFLSYCLPTYNASVFGVLMISYSQPDLITNETRIKIKGRTGIFYGLPPEPPFSMLHYIAYTVNKRYVNDRRNESYPTNY
jgi:hypothetical protein